MRYLSFLIIGLLFLIGCGKQDPETPESPRIKNKKNTRIISPSINQLVILGDEVSFEVSADEQSIDSVTLQVENNSTTFKASTFNWTPPTQRTGIYKMELTIYCGGVSEVHYPRIRLLSDIEPEEFTYVILGTYPHNTNDYTQGLFFLNDQLVESTGQRGKSEIKINALFTGVSKSTTPIGDEFFGEGCALYNDEIYQLTWTGRTGFVYDLDLNRKRTFQYQTEGWGLTTIGDSLLMSDGSENLYFMTPGDFSEIDRLEVYNNKGAVSSLNELEFINGLIYANEYQTDRIHLIEPTSGRVMKTIDLAGLLTNEEAGEADVLNGIAYDPIGDRLFVTGKWWPWLFEIKLKPKNTNS